MGHKGLGQYKVRDPGKQQDATVDRNRKRREMVLPHPSRYKRGKREPKEKVEVCPKNLAGDVVRSLKQMMMIVPVDTHVEETENVTEKKGNQWKQCRQIGRGRDLYIDPSPCVPSRKRLQAGDVNRQRQKGATEHRHLSRRNIVGVCENVGGLRSIRSGCRYVVTT